MAARSLASVLTPTLANASTKGSAEPSMIGTSGPSSVMTASETPKPAKAAITCSTVPTETPAAFVSFVQSCVSFTRS